MAKRYRSGRSKGLMAEINVVPYIDVMLVLLVIFMITTPLLTQGVKVNMPQAKAKALKSKSNLPIVVTVDEKGNYFLNVNKNPNYPMPVNKLAVRVAAELAIAKERGQQRQVLVKGDRNVDYGKVVQAMVMLQHAGVSEIGLMTQSPNNSHIG